VEEGAVMPFEKDGEGESPATGANLTVVVQKSCHRLKPRSPPYVICVI